MSRTPNRPRGNFVRGRENLTLDETKKKIIASIIQSGFTKSGMDFVDEVGKEIGGNRGVSSSQIRIAYGEITRLRMKGDDVPIDKVLMLKPKLYYAAGRNFGNKAYNYLRDIISYAVDLTCDDVPKEEQNRRFQNLASLFEAILAYHKAYGGK